MIGKKHPRHLYDKSKGILACNALGEATILKIVIWGFLESKKNINESRLERTLHLHHQQNESSGKEKTNRKGRKEERSKEENKEWEGEETKK